MTLNKMKNSVYSQTKILSETFKICPWPCGSKFKSRLFISTKFFLAPLSPRREITVVLRISNLRC